MLDTTSNTPIVAMFVIADLQTIAHTQRIEMFIIYHRIKLHIPSSSSSFTIAIKPKVKKKKLAFGHVGILHSTKTRLYKICMFFKHVLPRLISGH